MERYTVSIVDLEWVATVMGGACATRLRPGFTLGTFLEYDPELNPPVVMEGDISLEGGVTILLHESIVNSDKEVAKFLLEHEKGHVYFRDLPLDHDAGFLLDLEMEVRADRYAVKFGGASAEAGIRFLEARLKVWDETLGPFEKRVDEEAVNVVNARIAALKELLSKTK